MIGFLVKHGEDIFGRDPGETTLAVVAGTIAVAEAVPTGRSKPPHCIFDYAAGVPVAAGVLYPVLGILLSPVFAAAAMALSSVSVVANALQLRIARL